MSFYHSVSIGNLTLDGNIFLAPMAGYTDKVFRKICLENGADLAYTEMVSCEGVARKSKNTKELMERAEGEKNLAVQLFMPDADTALRSAEGVMEYNPQLIDVNCGCPVPKVIKTGAGSSLLKKPQEIAAIVKVLKRETGLPVTVKIRTGWDTDSINYIEVASSAFEAGADGVCMHARTRSQLYMPTAHWDHLRILKEHFPDRVIIGSGDLFEAEDAVRMFEETGVDAVAFASGSIGNPFVFNRVKAILQSREPMVITTEMKVCQILSQLNGMAEIIGEEKACREMRKHVCAYLKGIPNGAKVRQAISQARTKKDYMSALELL